MEKSNDYKYYSFDSDNSILYHEVTDENFSTKELFIISLSYFITLIERIQPEKLIIKIYKKPSYFERELNNFMQKTLYKAVLNAGIRKVAFYVSDEKYISELKEHERDDSIKARFFLDLASAKQWVLS